jgi:C1q domain
MVGIVKKVFISAIFFMAFQAALANPPLYGPLEVQNNLSEITQNGTQSTAQVNLFGFTISLGGNFATSGANSLTFTTTGTTNVTLPTSGTLLNNTTTIPYTQLPALSANQVLGSLTATTPSGQSVPSCSATGDALNWTSGTGFGCFTGYAPLLSPAFTGTPTSTTPATGNNTTQISTTAFVQNTFASPPSTGYGSTTPEPVASTTLNASGNDALLYETTNAQSIPSGVATTVTTWTEIFDRIGTNFNASTGTFTAPATGYYYISTQITFSTAAGIVSGLYAVEIVANSTDIYTGNHISETTATVSRAVSASGIVFLSSGQTVVVQAFQNSGSAVALNGNGPGNWFSVNRIP